jgi:hypothetical protein
VVTVEYQHNLNYRQLQAGSFPALLVRVAHQHNLDVSFDTDAYLDSGAECSLFDGALLSGLAIELINNKRTSYRATTGASVTAYLHNVRVTIPDIGTFNLEIGFSDVHISRNLLGRDFFNLVQIGFRENWREYYLTPSP